MNKTDFIKEHWDNQAERYGDSPEASWGDNYMIDLETGVISEYIQPGNKVLEAGCANGHSAFRQLKQHKSIRIEGIDFSEKMIEVANKKKKEIGIKDEIKFNVGDIRKIQFNDNAFDVVYTTRTLINLRNWEEQKQGIEECIRVTKPGGKIIFSEAFWEPLMKLNAIRSIANLPPLVEHDFNRYLKKSHLELYLKEKALSFDINIFSSVYYLGSRFLRELVTNPSDYPGYTNPVNKDFYELEKKYSGGGFGIQQAYIIEK